MRRAARVDDNQAEIVAALRKCGCTVQSLAALGSGVPDLLVGRGGTNYLLEVKDGSKPKSARELTPDELRWLHAWRGSAAVVETVEDALKEVGVLE
jgi:Holliday junction resolvase